MTGKNQSGRRRETGALMAPNWTSYVGAVEGVLKAAGMSASIRRTSWASPEWPSTSSCTRSAARVR